MRKQPKIFEGVKHLKGTSLLGDMAQMANGAASAFGDMRNLVSDKMHSRAERAKSVMRKTAKVAANRQSSSGQMKDMVPSEDFDAALARITALGKRIEALEAQLEARPSKKQAAVRKSAKKAAKKPAPKTANKV